MTDRLHSIFIPGCSLFSMFFSGFLNMLFATVNNMGFSGNILDNAFNFISLMP